MNRNAMGSSSARRMFLQLGMAAGVAELAGLAPSATAAQAPADTPWRPARHSQDDWLDKIPGVHRMVFDTTTAESMALALLWGRNYFAASNADYGLKDSDLAVVIVARHKATSFAYSSAIWAKYGKQLSDHSEFTDPKTKQAPTMNLYTAAGDRSVAPAPLDALISRGVQFAVCQFATMAIATKIAQATGTTPDSIMKEITANLIGNTRMVPAGIVAVNRTQERGYSLV